MESTGANGKSAEAFTGGNNCTLAEAEMILVSKRIEGVDSYQVQTIAQNKNVVTEEHLRRVLRVMITRDSCKHIQQALQTETT